MIVDRHKLETEAVKRNTFLLPTKSDNQPQKGDPKANPNITKLIAPVDCASVNRSITWMKDLPQEATNAATGENMKPL